MEGSKDKKTNQIAIAAIEIQTLHGHNFIERKIDRPINSRTGSITNLFEALVIGGIGRVTLPTATHPPHSALKTANK